MKLKNKSGTLVLTCLTAMLLLTSGMAFGAEITSHTTTVRTDKTLYLMDPFLWMYKASQYGVWPANGHDRTVTFYVNIYDNNGDPVDYTGINFEVIDNLNPSTPFASGVVTSLGNGAYEGSFDLTEAKLNAPGWFTGRGPDPRVLDLKILNLSGDWFIEHPVTVGRWGCDRCHMDNGTGVYFYPWSLAPGGPLGPHSWKNILGGSKDHGGFDITFLEDAEKTHTPTNSLNVHPFHEKTLRKQPWWDKCAPCHQGSGRVRYPFGDAENWNWVSQAASEAVECTFCHGIQGGYRPASGTWKENGEAGGYIEASHLHNTVPKPPWTARDPMLAIQGCANPGCHGHIDDDAEGEIQFNNPDCMKCHGIHNDDL
jgi:hypothetical protein